MSATAWYMVQIVLHPPNRFRPLESRTGNGYTVVPTTHGSSPESSSAMLMGFFQPRKKSLDFSRGLDEVLA